MRRTSAFSDDDDRPINYEHGDHEHGVFKRPAVLDEDQQMLQLARSTPPQCMHASVTRDRAGGRNDGTRGRERGGVGVSGADCV